MEVFIICTLMLYQLQITEPLIRLRWQHQQPWNQFRFEGPMDRVGQIPRLFDRYRIEREKVLRMLDRLTPEQRKRIATDESPPDQFSSPDRIRVQTRSSCSCDSQYEMKDFGDGYYPRYLAVSRCKPKACQNKFHSCQLLQYRVHVLKSREVSASSKNWFTIDDSSPETPLPEILRLKWQLQPIFVPVACVPA